MSICWVTMKIKLNNNSNLSFIDEGKFPDCNLPFRITDLLSHYLILECEKDKMPQMRWAFQILGRHLNLHAPNADKIHTIFWNGHTHMNSAISRR